MKRIALLVTLLLFAGVALAYYDFNDANSTNAVYKFTKLVGVQTYREQVSEHYAQWAAAYDKLDEADQWSVLWGGGVSPRTVDQDQYIHWGGWHGLYTDDWTTGPIEHRPLLSPLVMEWLNWGWDMQVYGETYTKLV